MHNVRRVAWILAFTTEMLNSTPAKEIQDPKDIPQKIQYREVFPETRSFNSDAET